jgi:hypothetical protein
MPPWTIALSSAIGAVVVVAALAMPEIINTPRSEIGATLLPQLPGFAVGALGVYGLGATLLTTTALVSRLLRLRQRVASDRSGRALARHDWVAALGPSRLGWPATRAARASETTDDGGVATPFTAIEARSDIAWRLYILLARSHFLSALIVLAGIVALGVAQDHGSLPFQTGSIPTVSAVLIVAGLMLLMVLGRIALDVTAEPLLETIAQSPKEPIEFGVLRRAMASFDASRVAAPADATTGEAARLAEQLVAAVEQGHRALVEAVSRLSENTQALEAAMRRSVEMLETTMRSAAAQRRPDGETVSDATSSPELQAAVEELTAVLRRLSTVPDLFDETALGGDAVHAPRKAPPSGLARELRRLLQEINTDR